MLNTDLVDIGNKLLYHRKRMGMTQTEMAEAAGLADRTYADIERGTVNMRIETMLRICSVMHITPNDLLTKEDDEKSIRQEEILKKLNLCTEKERETALRLLGVYLDSLNV